MLSIYTLKQTAKASKYYIEDNYYAKENDLLLGVWFGKGKELLNLTENANLEDFVLKLQGKLSSNITMEQTTKKRRPGYDLTFSAPKSVSILGVIAKDERVLNAHRMAVDEVLNYIEKNYAATRINTNNEISIEKTSNLLIAKFEHTDSRELDPNLHTHCVVMNATLRSDLKWRTLYFDEVYLDKILLGVIYRGKLAQLLMKAGFEIVQTSHKGFFELKGIPDNLIQQFSKRREQINQALKDLKLTGGKAAQIANFATRREKNQVSVENLELAWTVELQKCGLTIDWLLDYCNQAKIRGPVVVANPYNLVNMAVTKAILELSNWQSVFTVKELIKKSSGFVIDNCSDNLIEEVMAQKFKRGDLLTLKNNLCTTQEARDLSILNGLNVRQTKNKLFPMTNTLGANYLTFNQPKEHKNLLKFLLINCDQQVLIKSFVTQYVDGLNCFVKLSYKYGFYPIGITQVAKGVDLMQKELGLKRVQTIYGFFKSCENRLNKIKENRNSKTNFRSKQIWILDINSRISAEQVNRLQNYAKAFGTKIIWGFNIKNPQAALGDLIQHGIKKYQINLSQSYNYSPLSSHPIMHDYVNAASKNSKDDWVRKTADLLLDWVVDKNQEREAIVSLKDLQLELFSLGITIPKEVLNESLNARFKDGSLIMVNKELLTSKKMLELEKTCLDLTISSQNTFQPITLDVAKNPKLTVGQQQAIDLILTTSDQVVGIQGVAGSGKTTMLRNLNKLCLDLNFSIIGLSVTTSAKERLQQGSQDLESHNELLKSGIETLTLRKFLIDSEKLLNVDPTFAKIQYRGKLFVLDEASLVSTAEMFGLITKMQQLNTRLVLIGDNRQLPSIEAGNIFYLLLGSKMQSVAMTHNVRLKSLKILDVICYLYNNKISDAISGLSNSLIEIPEHNERLLTISKMYLEKTIDDRLHTILITPKHQDRKMVNNYIREGLKSRGELRGLEVNYKILTSRNLTKAESQKIYYYNSLDWILFLERPYGTSVKLQEYYQIVNKDLENQTLTLKSKELEIIWSPSKEPTMVAVFRLEERSLMTNDKIRWTKNNELNELINGQTATVIRINEKSVDFKLANQNLISLDLNELSNSHWDHGYAATSFTAQGLDQPITIALAEGVTPRVLKSSQLKVSDVIMIKEKNPDFQGVQSKWVKILAIDRSIATVQERNNQIKTIDLNKSINDLYGNQAVWHSYLEPEKRNKHQIPKLTSVAEFLVSISRGDNVTILVDNIESYQHALEASLTKYRSSLEYLDPNIKEHKSKVAQMTAKITGISDLIENKSKLTIESKNSLHINQAKMLNVEQVIEKLHLNILKNVTNWLNKPYKINNDEARFGNKGSLVVHLSGEKAGFWHNFEKGIGGKNLLSLYMDLFNYDFKTSINNLNRDLNIDLKHTIFDKIEAKSSKIKTSQYALIEQKKINYAQSIYNKGIPIEGTLAEKYLREFRGINCSIPADFRFCRKLKHPDLGTMVAALIVPIRNQHDEIQGEVRIFLNHTGNKLNTTYTDLYRQKQLATVKANLGIMANNGVIINPKRSSIVYIAEGIETALSILEVRSQDRIIAALSVTNLKNVPLPNNTQTVVLCADGDRTNSHSHQTLIKAADTYLERGLKVYIAYPEKNLDLKKIDFNDVLKNLGVSSISNSLENARAYKKLEINKLEPTPILKNNKELSL